MERRSYCQEKLTQKKISGDKSNVYSKEFAQKAQTLKINEKIRSQEIELSETLQKTSFESILHLMGMIPSGILF